MWPPLLFYSFGSPGDDVLLEFGSAMCKTPYDQEGCRTTSDGSCTLKRLWGSLTAAELEVLGKNEEETQEVGSARSNYASVAFAPLLALLSAVLV